MGRNVLGVPAHRRRFRAMVSTPAAERFYRLMWATCAYEEYLREHVEGQLEIDETMFDDVRVGKRGWGTAGNVIVFGILKHNGLVRESTLNSYKHRQILGKW